MCTANVWFCFTCNCYSPEHIASIMKLWAPYIERNNVQVELVRCREKLLLYSRLPLRSEKGNAISLTERNSRQLLSDSVYCQLSVVALLRDSFLFFLQTGTYVSMASVVTVSANVPESAQKESGSRDPSVCGCQRNYDASYIRGGEHTERVSLPCESIVTGRTITMCADWHLYTVHASIRCIWKWSCCGQFAK